MKSQISSCFAREAPWMANNGAGTSHPDFLAPELRCFPPYLAGAQKNRSWNKAITWMAAKIRLICLSKVPSPFSLSSVLTVSLWRMIRHEFTCSRGGGVCLRRKGGGESMETKPVFPGCVKSTAPPFPGIQSAPASAQVSVSPWTHSPTQAECLKWDHSDVGSMDV